MCWSHQAFEISALNIAALAEWSWNSGGRTVDEFVPGKKR
jgi:hypothetical protein